ncbi:MAG: carboxymuconolactone decarboxylase family protein [Candidatus Palauibacterales bacterium]|nr:carboxymuconolactone decarboxylase family protein [Candidatus Palauibacterales bacterium]
MSGSAALAELSAGLAAGDDGELETLLRSAAEEAGPVAVEEAILQSHLFLGFPAALRGMRVWRRLREDAGEEGAVGFDAAAPSEWEARGEEVCRRVYGSAYRGLRRNVGRLHPDLDAWMIRDGYGKVLGREGLDLAARELCIVATLAADGSPRQPLHSHLRGALRAGAEPADVEEALEAGLAKRPDTDRTGGARELWRRVRERATSDESRPG